MASNSALDTYAGPTTPIEFVICYDVARAYEDRALSLARCLYEVYDTGIDALTLKPTETDDLILYFNHRVVRSLRHDGRAPTVADVGDLFQRERIVVTRRAESDEAGDDTACITVD